MIHYYLLFAGISLPIISILFGMTLASMGGYGQYWYDMGYEDGQEDVEIGFHKNN